MAPIDQAIAILDLELNQLTADQSIKPLDAKWFLRQARGHAISHLQTMKEKGLHQSEATAAAYRRMHLREMKSADS